MIDKRWLLPGLIAIGLTGCSLDDDDDDDDEDFVERPDFIVGEISEVTHQGPNDDLLTAGLGLDGLMGAAPGYADPANPTVAELRRNVIYNNYRALQDPTAAGGFGRFYGPNVDNPVDDDQGLIPGTEYIAYADAGDGVQVVTHMVQVPDHFDPDEPCIVTGTSSGSRDVYGAIGTSGEWGLKRGCAVAYTNKGTGTGFHLLEREQGYGMRGQLIDADDEDVGFLADLTDAQRQDFLAEYPDRIATRHAHSKLNSEADWGRYTLQAVRFAFYVLNQQFTEDGDDDEELFRPGNTLVIGSSVSNGGGAALRALEQDTDRLIDGVAVSEPNVQPATGREFTIRQGDDDPIETGEHSKSLLDYTTYLALYQPCANLGQPAELLPTSPAFLTQEVAENRCTSLRERGLLTADTLDDQIEEAQQRINDYAIPQEQNPAQASNTTFLVPESIAYTYASQYGLYGVEDRYCGFSYAATDANGTPTAYPDAAAQVLFAGSNGIPPTGGISLVYDEAEGGARNITVAASPSTGRMDRALDGIVCLREALEDDNVLDGIEEVRASGDLRGRPAVIVTGRADAILPINFTSRPYYALNKLVEGDDSELHYYEITNAHHLDAFNAFPGLAARFVPLHYYFGEALDLLYDHLRDGDDLPPSQVVHTTPRGDGAPELTAANLPDIEDDPDDENLIVFEDDELFIPD